MPKGFRRVGSVRHGVKGSINQSINKAIIHNSPPDSMQAKMLVKLIFLSLAVMSLIFFVISGFELSPSTIVRSIKDKMVLEQAEGSGYPLETDGNRSLDIKPISHGVAVLTDTNYMLLDDKGREASSNAHYMSSPVMKTSGRYILLYDKGALSYSLNTLAGTLLSQKTENTILSGDLSSSGKFVLVTSHETSFSQVQVFSKSGSVLHRWKSSNCYVYNAAISPSGNHIALCGVYSEGGIMKCNVMVQKVGGVENLAEFTFNEMLPLAIEFFDNDNVAVIGDNMLSVINIGSKNKSEYKYDELTINGFDISDNGTLALLLSKYNDGRNCSIVLLNKKCSKVAEIETQLASPSIELTRNRINLISYSKFYSYNYSGVQVKSADVSADCQECITYSGDVLLRGNSMISLLK